MGCLKVTAIGSMRTAAFQMQTARRAGPCGPTRKANLACADVVHHPSPCITVVAFQLHPILAVTQNMTVRWGLKPPSLFGVQVVSPCRLSISARCRPSATLFSRCSTSGAQGKIDRSQAHRRPFARSYFSANALPSHKDASGSRVLHPGKQEEAVSVTAGAQNVQQEEDPVRLQRQQDRQTSRSQTSQLDRRKADQEDASSIEPAQKAYPIRPDAPSRLTSLSSSLPQNSLRKRLALFLSLSKPNLSFLIVLTTAASYALYPVPPLLTSTVTTSPSLSALTLVFLTSGTALCCASANALNMLFEPEHDAKMSRTRNRPLVRGLLSKRAALLFAIATGAIGTTALYTGVNPTVAGLGALNIALYAGVYTPMKRVSVLNTWVGAIVGGIPPLMGWAAAAGQAATGDGGPADLLLGEKNAGGWLLAALLFAWQFPHFNALSWSIREEYKAAGYRMLVSFKPKMNARVALRYSILMFPICFGLSAAGVTDKFFVLTSSVVNAWMVKEAVRFWKHEGHKGTARGLFWASVWHLPVVMVLAMAHKKGLWEGLWQRMFGDAEEDEWMYEDEEAEAVVPIVTKEGSTLVG